MSLTLGTLVAYLDADPRGLNRAVDGSEKRLGGLGSRAGRVAASIGAAFGAIAIGGFLKDSVAEARESQKVGALTAQVIKSTGGAAKVTAAQVGQLATAISNKTAIDDEAIQSAANLLLTFTNVRNEVGKGNDIFNQATATAADMAATLGGDAAGQAVALGKALNDPVKGVTALGRVGVSFTEQQKKQIKSLVEHNDTLGAQKIILGELQKEFGGSAAAQATAGDKAKVAIGNLKEAIGTGLLPIIDKTATFATSVFIPMLYRIGGYLSSTLGPIFRVVGDAVRSFAGGLSGKGPIDGFVGLLNTIGLALRALFLAFREGDVTSDGLVGRFERIGVALRTILPQVLRGAQLFLASLLPALRAVASFITGSVVPSIQNLLRAVAPVLLNALKLVIAAGVIAFRVALATIPPVLSRVGAALRAVTGFFAEHRTTTAAVASIIAVLLLPTLAGLAIGYATTGTAAALSAARQVAAWLATQAGAIATNAVLVVSFALTVAGWIRMGAVAMFNALKMAAAWLIAMGPVGLVIAAVIAVTVLIVKNWDTVRNATVTAFKAVWGAIKSVFGWVKSNWPLLLAILTGPVGLAVLFIVRKWDTIVSTVRGIGGRIKRAAVGMFDGIIDAFRAAINLVIDGWNSLRFSIPGFDPPGPGPKFGGFTLGVPRIPRLAAGGIVKATPGGVLALLGEGGHDERVTPLDGRHDRPTVVIEEVNNYGVDAPEANRQLARTVTLALAGYSA